MTELGRKRLKLLLLQGGGFLTGVAPLLFLVITRAERYVSTPQDGVRLGLGGGLALLLLFFKSIGRLKIPGRLMGSGIVCLLAFLLSALLADILLLSLAVFLGDLLELLFFSIPVRSAKESIQLCRTSTATAQAVESVLKSYNGRC